jgi:hypothetical protein
MTQLGTTLSIERRSEVDLKSSAPALGRWPVAGPLPFGLVAAQFALMVLIVRLFELEGAAFADLLALAWVGFILHHFLPARYRLPFFAGLSVASLPLVLGFRPAAGVLACGCILIGVCHLRASFRMRVLLIVILGCTFAACRLALFSPPIPRITWMVLGSMFMFRLIVYLYDLRTHSAPFSFTRAIAYFFMLPNVCFPLYPVVDYKTFCTTHYNDDPLPIYQRGLRWMLRGLVQLLIYRLLYQFAQVDPLDVTDLGGVVQFMVTTYLIYLRISGQFHLIVGLLHLFGFNLPETHHLYLLSSSFTDFWRRINIYWKDFIQKIFFYPAYFRFKRLGHVWALALATAFAFVVTWLLHAYQWMWLRGSPTLFDWEDVRQKGALRAFGEWLWSALPFTWNDTIFWWILAVLVLLTTLRDARNSRRKALQKLDRTVRGQLGLALRTAAFFVVICTLWTFWSIQSLDELTWLVSAARHATPGSVLAILAGLIGLGIAAMLFGHSTAERTETAKATASSSDRFAFWPNALLVTASCCGLLLLGMAPAFPGVRDTLAGELLVSVRQDRLNQMELNALRRGYYEELDVTRQDVKMHDAIEPTAWMRGLRMVMPTGDIRLHEPIPGLHYQVHGKTITTNRWGCRGRAFEQVKTPGVFRIAILGSSTENGWGIGDESMFDKLLEDHLNQENRNEQIRKFEVLNFSVDGYGSIQKLLALEKARSFTPDLVLYVTYLAEPERTADTLGQAYAETLEIPEPFRGFVHQIFEEARLDPAMTRTRVERRIKRFMPGLVGEVFQEFARQCHQHGLLGGFVYRPDVAESRHLQAERRQAVLDRARQTGLPVLDLSAAFHDISDRDSLMVAARRSYNLAAFKREAMDDHPNELGHRLLADELFRVLNTAENRWLLSPTSR